MTLREIIWEAMVQFNTDHCGDSMLNSVVSAVEAREKAESFVDVEPLKVSDLWLDANQGEGRHGQAFGYVGTEETDIDEDGDSCEYCGWFFDWPSAKAKITSEAERQAVIDSLDTDETARHLSHIPQELAEAKLTAYLDKKFPGDLDEPTDE